MRCLILLAALLFGLTSPVCAQEADATQTAALTQQFDKALAAKDWPAALAAIDQLIAAAPHRAELLPHRADVLAEMQRFDEASAADQQALDRDGGSASNWNAVCWHRILAGQYLAAREGCEHALRFDSLSAATAINLGHSYLLAGETQKAYGWYARGLELLPNKEALQQDMLGDFDRFIAEGRARDASEKARVWVSSRFETPKYRALREALAASEACNQSLMTPGDKHSQPLCQRALVIRVKHLGAEHADVAQSLNSLALVAFYAGDESKAEATYRRARAMQAKQLGADAVELAWTDEYLAELFLVQGRYPDAEASYLSMLAILEKQFGPKSHELATRLQNLGMLYHDMGREDDAEKYLRRALTIREQRFDARAPVVASSLCALGTLYRDTGRLDVAEAHFLRGLSIWEDPAIVSGETIDGVKCERGLGRLYLKQDRYDLAQARFDRALTGLMQAPNGQAELPDFFGDLAELAGLRQADALAVFFDKLAVNSVQWDRLGRPVGHQQRRLKQHKDRYVALAERLRRLGRAAEAKRVDALWAARTMPKNTYVSFTADETPVATQFHTLSTGLGYAAEAVDEWQRSLNAPHADAETATQAEEARQTLVSARAAFAQALESLQSNAFPPSAMASDRPPADSPPEPTRAPQ